MSVPNYPEIYLSMIQSGDEVVSAKVREVYEREVAFMHNPPKDFPYYFDPEEELITSDSWRSFASSQKVTKQKPR